MAALKQESCCGGAGLPPRPVGAPPVTGARARRLREVASAVRGIHSSPMSEIAYLFERFPSFGQTFCYREVTELERQGMTVHVFSIRRPMGEPAEDWDESLVERVHYLPEEKPLVAEVDRILKTSAVSDHVRATVKDWG